MRWAWTQHRLCGGGQQRPVVGDGSVAPNFPVLSAALSATPLTVTAGQLVTIIETVQNIGVVDAPAVTLNANQGGKLTALAGTAGATYFAGPSPAGNTTLTPTASASFTYTYSATGSGVLIFTGTASSLGQTCTAGTSNGVLVQTADLDDHRLGADAQRPCFGRAFQPGGDGWKYRPGGGEQCGGDEPFQAGSADHGS